jgi:2-polyprenyl-3-methyl-5-hydroxy-6-metoxy-1,4-benzoquinol methylase
MNGKNCPLCDQSKIDILEVLDVEQINMGYKKFFGIEDALQSNIIQYCKCNSCGVQFFDPMETGRESLYESLQKFDWYYMADKYEFQVAKKYCLPNRNILEIGAGRAAFAKQIETSKYTGLEFNNEAIRRAAEVGVTLIKENAEVHADNGSLYDVVVSFQVLEHVSEPAVFLKACVRLLREKGILIIAVPGSDGFLGQSTNHFLDMPPHHVSRWSEQALRSIAKIFDLQVKEIVYEPVAAYHVRSMSKVFWEKRIRKIFGARTTILDFSFAGRVFAKIAMLMAVVLPVSSEGVKGHTVIVVYEKN